MSYLLQWRVVETGTSDESHAVLIGTSGYSYKDWIGRVYPPGLPSSEYLTWYSARFRFVEIDFSYYRMPAAATLSRMASAVPDGFRFAIKAHRSLTHDRDADWPESLDRFRAAVSPLEESGKLAAVLFQFPFSFHYTTQNRRYLADLSGAAKPLPVFIEFRNSEWTTPRVFDYMRRNALNLTFADLPTLKGLPELTPLVTGDAAYLRLHGRNARTWWSGDNVSRYDYRYSQEELASLAQTVRAVADKVTLMLIAFNNHFQGSSFENAREMQSLLARADSHRADSR